MPVKTSIIYLIELSLLQIPLLLRQCSAFELVTNVAKVLILVKNCENLEMGDNHELA